MGLCSMLIQNDRHSGTFPNTILTKFLIQKNVCYHIMQNQWKVFFIFLFWMVRRIDAVTYFPTSDHWHPKKPGWHKQISTHFTCKFCWFNLCRNMVINRMLRRNCIFSWIWQNRYSRWNKCSKIRWLILSYQCCSLLWSITIIIQQKKDKFEIACPQN